MVSASLGNMMSSVWLVLAATWVKQGHGGAGAWTAILVVSAIGGLAAPSVRHLQRLDAPQPEQSAQQSVAD